MIRFVSMIASLFGGLEEIRTPDPHNANVVRSQLRYKPLFTYRDIIALPRAKVKQNLLNSRNFPGAPVERCR